MASEQMVRQYLAYWFQLGKGVVVNGGQKVLLPKPVFQGNHYSSSFEQCWQQIQPDQTVDAYLEGTSQTIAELLSPGWDIVSCARCTMPIPMKNIGAENLECPCFDIEGWPNTELPQPRSAVNSADVLSGIRARLNQARSN